MRKYYYVIIVCLSLLTVRAQQTKSGVIDYPLTSNNGMLPTGIKSLDTSDKGASPNTPTGKNRYTPDGIVLTDNRVAYSGFYIDDLEIDLMEGVNVEFEYALASIPSLNTAKGNGMTFFIFDSSYDVVLGYRLDALGYAYNEASGANGMRKGLPGGYLGIGFDYTGGFKEFYSFSEQFREGISAQRYKDAGLNITSFGNYHSNHITLRGASIDARQSKSYKGNPVLLTKYFGSSAVAEGAISMATLDANTGQYKFGRNESVANFSVGNGGTDDKLNFQKIRVELAPASDGKAMLVTVKVLIGGKEFLLIDSYRYETKVKAFDKENQLYELATAIPKKVKIGFTASTGNYTAQKAIVRNLKVSLSNALVLEDLTIEMCVSSKGGSKDAKRIVSLFKDADFSVDANSFSFLDGSGKAVGTSYTQANVGKWSYSASQKEVTLTLSNANFKPKDAAEVSYVVSSKEGVKSESAKIKVEGIPCGAIYNPQLRVKDSNTPYVK